MDARIISGGQNNTPIVAASVLALLRANALTIVQVNASGDIINPVGAQSDGALLDGLNAAIRATILSLTNSNPQVISAAGPSGEVYPNRARTVNYGRVNVLGTATKVLSSNSLRLGYAIQNLEKQQVAYGYNSALTFINLAGVLGPTSSPSSSGDGGFMGETDYTGEVWALGATGDCDVAFKEFIF